jgi:hypothetical protein
VCRPGRGLGQAQGQTLQAAEQGGDEGQDHRLHEVQPGARDGAIRLRAVAQGGEGFGQVVPLN